MTDKVLLWISGFKGGTGGPVNTLIGAFVLSVVSMIK
jgi:hypothetical protein